jgi:dihydropteroate synthase
MRPVFHWSLGARALELGKQTLIMGVVNVTPDSFSDGGQFLDHDKAVEHGERLLEDGADIIDIGGESTRPGARVDAGPPSAPSNQASESARVGADAACPEQSRGVRPASKAKASAAASPVSTEEELTRVIPVITELKKRHPKILVSIDTYKSAVARAAVNAGAAIVNDVSGLRWDPQMARTVADLKCGAVLMHMRGRPEEWRNLPPAGDIVLLVKRELKDWAERAVLAGVRRERIVLDPGFGFGKSFDENYPLIARFEVLQAAGFPVLVGTSRKSFIGRTVGAGRDVSAEQRLYGTLATQTALILKGAHIVRTHDVKASLEAARVADAILLAR